MRAFDLFALDEAVGEACLPVGAVSCVAKILPPRFVQAHRLRAEIDEQRSVFGYIGGVGDFYPVLAMSERVDQAVRDEEAVEDAELFFEF